MGYPSIEFPPRVEKLFQVLTGEQAGSTREGRLRDFADLVDDLAAGMRTAEPLLATGVRRIRSGVQGGTHDAFLASMERLLGRDGLLEAAAVQLNGIGGKLRKTSTDVQYGKLMVIAILVELLIEIAIATAFAFFNPVAAMEWLAGRSAVAKFLIKTTLGKVLLAIAASQVIGVGLNVVMDAIVQHIQIRGGWRDGFDGKLLRNSAAGGSLGGALGLVLGGAGGAVVGRMGRFGAFGGEAIGEVGSEVLTEGFMNLAETGHFKVEWSNATAGLTSAGAGAVGEGIGDSLRPDGGHGGPGEGPGGDGDGSAAAHDPGGGDSSGTADGPDGGDRSGTTDGPQTPPAGSPLPPSSMTRDTSDRTGGGGPGRTPPSGAGTTPHAGRPTPIRDTWSATSSPPSGSSSTLSPEPSPGSSSRPFAGQSPPVDTGTPQPPQTASVPRPEAVPEHGSPPVSQPEAGPEPESLPVPGPEPEPRAEQPDPQSIGSPMVEQPGLEQEQVLGERQDGADPAPARDEPAPGPRQPDQDQPAAGQPGADRSTAGLPGHSQPGPGQPDAGQGSGLSPARHGPGNGPPTAPSPPSGSSTVDYIGVAPVPATTPDPERRPGTVAPVAHPARTVDPPRRRPRPVEPTPAILDRHGDVMDRGGTSSSAVAPPVHPADIGDDPAPAPVRQPASTTAAQARGPMPPVGAGSVGARSAGPGAGASVVDAVADLASRLPGLSSAQRASALEFLSAADRERLASDPAVVDALRAGLSAAEFAQTAAQLLVQVPAGVDQPVSARHEVQARIARMLGDPEVAARLLKGGSRVVVVPKGEAMTSLSPFRHLAGQPVGESQGPSRRWDDVRGSGDRTVAVTEENLLGERTDVGPSPNYPAGYSTTTHEFAHAIHQYGLSTADRKVITDSYRNKLAKGHGVPWPDGPLYNTADQAMRNYSSTTELEYFAQVTNAYLGTNTGVDPYTGQPRNNGAAWVRQHEPALLPILERLYGPDPHAAPAGQANPVDRTQAENDLYDGYRAFWDQVENTHRPQPHPPAPATPAPTAPNLTTPPGPATAPQHSPPHAPPPDPAPKGKGREGKGKAGKGKTGGEPSASAPSKLPGEGKVTSGSQGFLDKVGKHLEVLVSELIPAQGADAEELFVSGEKDRVGFVATVAATPGRSLVEMANIYKAAFADEESRRGRFGLVIGVNAADYGDSRAKVIEAVKKFRQQWRGDFPVAVVGFVWKDSRVKDSITANDQAIVPYGLIREFLMRQPASERFVRELTQAECSAVYVHTGDADVVSLHTRGGAELFDAAGEKLRDVNGERVDVASGGYLTPPSGAPNAVAVRRAALLDLAVREAMASVDPASVYFPEPNTFVRLRTEDGMATLEKDVTFGAERKEGESLVTSLFKQREYLGMRWLFDADLAIVTNGDRIGEKVGPQGSPADLMELAQSHARPITWRDQIERYAEEYLRPRKTLSPQQLNLLQDIAFHGSIDNPVGWTDNLKGQPTFTKDELALLRGDNDGAVSTDDKKAVIAKVKKIVGKGERLTIWKEIPKPVRLIALHTRAALVDTLCPDAAPSSRPAPPPPPPPPPPAHTPDDAHRIDTSPTDHPTSGTPHTSSTPPEQDSDTDPLVTDRFEYVRSEVEQDVLRRVVPELRAASQGAFHPEEGPDGRRRKDIHRILAHFSGEVPIHAAAMALDDKMVLEIHYDPVYFLDEQRRLEFREGQPAPAEGDPRRIEQLVRQGWRKATGMRDELVAMGIGADRIRVVYAPDVEKVVGRHVSDTHRSVADKYFDGEPEARGTLRETVFREINEERRAEIERQVDERLGLRPGQKVVLLWNRRSGLTPGGAYPELDMTDRFLDQIATRIRDQYPDARVILVGDKPGPGFAQAHSGLVDDRANLVEFWKPYKLKSRAEQVYLLDLLRDRYEAVAIGMESGAIELPILLGMKTVYLERRPMRAGKATRWTYVSASSYGDPAHGPRQDRSGPVTTWRRQQFEAPTEWLFYMDRLKRLFTQWTAADTDLQRARTIRAIETAFDGWLSVISEYETDNTATVPAAADWITLSAPVKQILQGQLDRLRTVALGADDLRISDVPLDHPERLRELAENWPTPAESHADPHSVDDPDSVIEQAARICESLRAALEPLIKLGDGELDRLIAQLDGFDSPSHNGRWDVKRIEAQAKRDRDDEADDGRGWIGPPKGLKLFGLADLQRASDAMEELADASTLATTIDKTLSDRQTVEEQKPKWLDAARKKHKRNLAKQRDQVDDTLLRLGRLAAAWQPYSAKGSVPAQQVVAEANEVHDVLLEKRTKIVNAIEGAADPAPEARVRDAERRAEDAEGPAQDAERDAQAPHELADRLQARETEDSAPSAGPRREPARPTGYEPNDGWRSIPTPGDGDCLFHAVLRSALEQGVPLPEWAPVLPTRESPSPAQQLRQLAADRFDPNVLPRNVVPVRAPADIMREILMHRLPGTGNWRVLFGILCGEQFNTLLRRGLRETELWDSTIGDDMPGVLSAVLGINIVVHDVTSGEPLHTGAHDRPQLHVQRANRNHYEALASRPHASPARQGGSAVQAGPSTPPTELTPDQREQPPPTDARSLVDDPVDPPFGATSPEAATNAVSERYALTGSGTPEDYTDDVLSSPIVRDAVSRILSALGALPQGTAARVEAFVLDGLMSTSVVPAHDDQEIRPWTPQQLERVLNVVANQVERGRDPFAHPESPLLGFPYTKDAPFARRLAELWTANLTPDGRARLTSDRLFRRLLDSPDVLAAALSGAVGHDPQRFLNTCVPATVNTLLRSAVPTIAGQLVVGRDLADQIERAAAELRSADPQVLQQPDRPFGDRTLDDLINQRLRGARDEFDRLEQRADRLADTNEADPAEWARLSTDWGRSMQKLGAVIDPKAGAGPIPVLTKKLLDSWAASAVISAPLGVDRPTRRMEGIDDSLYCEATSRLLDPMAAPPAVNERPLTAPLPEDFWARLHRSGPRRVSLSGSFVDHAVSISAVRTGGTRAFRLDDPKNAGPTVVTPRQFERWLNGRTVHMAPLPALPGPATATPGPSQIPAWTPPGEVIEDYDVTRGRIPPFTRTVAEPEVHDRGDTHFPRYVVRRPVYEDAHPPLRVSPDRTIAINAITAGQKNEFYTTKERAEEMDKLLKRSGSAVSLTIVEENTVQIKSSQTKSSDTGPVLVMVRPHFFGAMPAICRDFAGRVMGGEPSHAVLRPNGPPVPGTAEVAAINPDNNLEVTGVHHLADRLAAAASTGSVAEVDTTWARDVMAQDGRDRGGTDGAPRPGREYGLSVHSNPNLNQAAQALGINQYAWAQVGEGYLTQSVGRGSGADVAFDIDYSFEGRPIERSGAFGYHFAPVVAESADHTVQITLENARRGRGIDDVADEAIRRNIEYYRANGAPRPDDPAAKAYLDQFTELANHLGDADAFHEHARSLRHDIFRDSPELGSNEDMRHFRMWGNAPAQSFHASQQQSPKYVNPLTMVVVGHGKSHKIVDFEPESVTVDSEARALESFARTAVHVARWRARQGLPPPAIQVDGGANGRGILRLLPDVVADRVSSRPRKIGRQRADAVHDVLRENLTRIDAEIGQSIEIRVETRGRWPAATNSAIGPTPPGKEALRRRVTLRLDYPASQPEAGPEPESRPVPDPEPQPRPERPESDPGLPSGPGSDPEPGLAPGPTPAPVAHQSGVAVPGLASTSLRRKLLGEPPSTPPASTGWVDVLETARRHMLGATSGPAGRAPMCGPSQGDSGSPPNRPATGVTQHATPAGLRPPRALVEYFGAPLAEVADYDTIITRMAATVDGSRAVLVVWPTPDQPGHAVNVIHTGGRVHFLDASTGRRAALPAHPHQLGLLHVPAGFQYPEAAVYRDANGNIHLRFDITPPAREDIFHVLTGGTGTEGRDH
jgi:hypothetical protein